MSVVAKRQLKLTAITPSERQSQYSVVDWWRYYAASKKIPEHLLFAIVNGAVLKGDGRERAIQMNSLKRGGLRPGVADLFLSLPRMPYSGLFLEMKAEGGTISDAQIAFGASVKLQGYQWFVAFSSEQACMVIQHYVEGKPLASSFTPML